MLIEVIYPGMQHDYVDDFMLDSLIESGRIIKFRRQSGWVTLGVDPVRQKKRCIWHKGEERRFMHHNGCSVAYGQAG